MAIHTEVQRVGHAAPVIDLRRVKPPGGIDEKAVPCSRDFPYYLAIVLQRRSLSVVGAFQVEA